MADTESNDLAQKLSEYHHLVRPEDKQEYRSQYRDLDTWLLHSEAAAMEEEAMEVFREVLNSDADVTQRLNAAKAMAAIAKDRRTRADKRGEPTTHHPRSYTPGTVPGPPTQ